MKMTGSQTAEYPLKKQRQNRIITKRQAKQTKKAENTALWGEAETLQTNESNTSGNSKQTTFTLSLKSLYSSDLNKT